jgi:DNA-binding winged helix-turn-helix (wHTH) protein
VPRYHFGEFVLSPRRRLLLRSGAEQPLIPRYFDLLLLLIERRGEAVHRQRIFEAVWRDVVVSDSALTQAIRTIRRTLGDDPREPRFVRTVSRHGYQFVWADVVEEDDADEVPIRSVGSDVRSVGPSGPTTTTTTTTTSPADPFAPLLAQISRRAPDTAAQEEQLEAAERLHALGTAEALRRLALDGNNPLARALLRDARWDVAGAGPVPIAGEPHALRGAIHLMELRLSRAAGLVAARWAGASVGAGLSGALGGACGGLLLVLAPGSIAPPAVIAVLAMVGAACGAAGGAGVGAGLAVAEATMRSRRATALLVGGAAGGAAIGTLVQWLTRWSLSVLFGLTTAVGGGIEGLVIGAGAAVGFALAAGRTHEGLAAPRGVARLRVAAVTALFCALAALALSLAGRPLIGGTVNAVAQAAAGSTAALAPLGRIIGEPGFGPITAALAATGEGALFGAGLALGLTRRPR